MVKIDRRAIYDRDGGLCGFCGEHVIWAEFEADHVPPRGFGLPHERLRVSHRLCNRRAGWDVRRVMNQPIEVEGYALRLPPSLKTELETLAKRDHRSLNAEIIHALELFVKADQRKP